MTQRDDILNILNEYGPDMTVSHNPFYIYDGRPQKRKGFLKEAITKLCPSLSSSDVLAVYDHDYSGDDFNYFISGCVFTDKRMYYLKDSGSKVRQLRYDMIEKVESYSLSICVHIEGGDSHIFSSGFFDVAGAHRFFKALMDYFTDESVEDLSASESVESYMKRINGQDTISLFQLCIKYQTSPAEMITFLSSIGLPASEDPDFAVTLSLLPLLDSHFTISTNNTREDSSIGEERGMLWPQQ